MFGAQHLENAGKGAHASLITCLFLVVIGTLSLFRGHKLRWRGKDRFVLIASMVAIGLWYFSNDTLYSVLLLILVEFIAFVPTFVKGVKDPYSESAFFYMLAGLKYFSSLFSFDAFNYANMMYPLYAVICYGSFAMLVFYLRMKYKKSAEILTG